MKGWTLETRGPRGAQALIYGNQSVVFDPAARHLAILSQDGTIRIWDTDSGRLIQVFLSAFSPWQAMPLPGMAWSRDGQILAAASCDGLIRFWEVSTGRILRTWTVGDAGGITILAWSPDGETIGVGFHGIGGARPGIVLWDVDSGKPTDTVIPAKLPGNAVWSPDSQNMAIYDRWSGEVVVWRRDSGKVASVATSNGPYLDSSLAWSPDSRLLACGMSNVPVRVFDIKEHRLLASVGEALPFTGAVCWLDDGKSLAVGGKVWNVDSGKAIKAYTADAERVVSQAWSPDGSMWVLFGSRQRVVLYSRCTSSSRDKVRFSMNAHPFFVNYTSGSWSLSPEAKTLALASTYGKIWLWDLYTASQPRSIHLGSSSSVISWFPDNRRLVVADQSMRLYDVETGRIDREDRACRDAAHDIGMLARWQDDSRSDGRSSQALHRRVIAIAAGSDRGSERS